MQPDQAWLLPCRCFSAPFRYPEFAPAPLYICNHQRCMPGILTIPVLSLSLISCPCSGKQVSGVQSAVRPRRQVWDGRRQVRRRWLAPGCRPLQLPGASASSLSQYGNAAANLLLFIPPACPQGGVYHGVCATADCLEVQRAARGRLSGGAAGAAAAAAARVGVAQLSGTAGVARCRRTRLPPVWRLMRSPVAGPLNTLPDSQATELFPATQSCCFLCSLPCSALFLCRWLLPCSLRCSHLPAAFCNTRTHTHHAASGHQQVCYRWA